MRVGIVGSAGTGKSTLAAELGKAFGAPVIEDFTFKALEEEVGRPSWSGLRDTRIRRAVRLKAIELKKAAENAADAFVSDKTVVDYAAYWLNNQSEYETLEQTLEALELCRSHMSRYDVCVFLPYRDDIDYSEHRSSDPVHNLKLSVMKQGLLALFGARVVNATYTFGEDIDAWIARWITPALAGGSADGAAGSAESPPAKRSSAKGKAPATTNVATPARSKAAAKSKGKASAKASAKPAKARRRG